MINWAVIQEGAYNTASNRARALSETIINSKLSRAELESIDFIIQLEIMKRKQRRTEKKNNHQEEYKGQQQGQAQGPGSAAAPGSGQ